MVSSSLLFVSSQAEGPLVSGSDGENYVADSSVIRNTSEFQPYTFNIYTFSWPIRRRARPNLLFLYFVPGKCYFIPRDSCINTKCMILKRHFHQQALPLVANVCRAAGKHLYRTTRLFGKIFACTGRLQNLYRLPRPLLQMKIQLQALTPSSTSVFILRVDKMEIYMRCV